MKEELNILYYGEIQDKKTGTNKRNKGGFKLITPNTCTTYAPILLSLAHNVLIERVSLDSPGANRTILFACCVGPGNTDIDSCTLLIRKIRRVQSILCMLARALFEMRELLGLIKCIVLVFIQE